MEPGEVEEVVEVETFDLELFIYHNLDYELLKHVIDLRYLFFEVERVQISCWEGSSRPEVDPPCCRWAQFFGEGSWHFFVLPWGHIFSVGTQGAHKITMKTFIEL